MLIHQTLAVFVTFTMTSLSSAVHPPAAASSAATGSSVTEAEPQVHDIMMHDYYDPTGQTTLVKFRSVPVTYDIMDIKHADHVGMFCTFTNNETWLTLKEKRLFLVATSGDYPPAPESIENWPIMGPEELHEALKEFPSYEEVSAKWQAVQDRVFPLKSTTLLGAVPSNTTSLSERDYRTCRNVACQGSWNCYPESDSNGDCFRCNYRSCTWRDNTNIPNAVIIGPGGSHGGSRQPIVPAGGAEQHLSEEDGKEDLPANA